MVRRKGNRVRLTPAIARQQANEVVIENFEAANKVLREARLGRPTGPATLWRARKQRFICYNELVRRGYSRDDLDYEPPPPPTSEEISDGAGVSSAGGSLDPSAGTETLDAPGASGPGAEL